MARCIDSHVQQLKNTSHFTNKHGQAGFHQLSFCRKLSGEFLCRGRVKMAVSSGHRSASRTQFQIDHLSSVLESKLFAETQISEYLPKFTILCKVHVEIHINAQTHILISDKDSNEKKDKDLKTNTSLLNKVHSAQITSREQKTHNNINCHEIMALVVTRVSCSRDLQMN